MTKFWLIIVISLTTLTSPCLAASSNSNHKGEKTMNIEKPDLILYVDFAGCTYEPSLNGVKFTDMGGPDKGVLATAMPVNQWVKSGKNEFSLILKPSDQAEKLKNAGQDCRAKVALKVKPNKTKSFDPRGPQYKSIATYEFHSAPDNITKDESHFKGTTQAGQLDSSKDFKRVDSGGDIQIGPIHIEQIDTEYGPGVKMTREVDMPLPFPKWAWFDGDQIPDNEETKEELTQQYKQIWQALKNQNIESYASDFEKRTQEYAEAYYVSKNEVNLIKDLAKKEKDPDLELGGFQPKYQHVRIYGHGKLAKLLSWDGLPAIFFNNKEKDMSHDVDISFMKKNGEWKIIR